MNSAPPSSPAAVRAFLRGLDKRARLFATAQAGSAVQGAQALQAVARVFAGEAAQWPLAEWPRHYWRLLLATPALRQVGGPGSDLVAADVGRLAPRPRAAVLLHLLAGLDDEAAAGALGTSLDDYHALIRDSLPLDAAGQPDVKAWLAWRAAAQQALDRAPEPPPLDGRPAPAGAGPADVATPSPSRITRWLWLGVALCVLAFVATFFIHPAGRQAVSGWFSQIRVEPLPPADAPTARYAAGDLALHPDRALLASPREAGYAAELPLWAWLAHVSDPAVEAPVALPALQPGMQPAQADAAIDLRARVRHWDALDLQERARQRGAWQAWRRLEPAERVRLRAIAERFRLLPAEQQQALRERFAGQSHDARHGWWLGPRLGRDWPRVAALFGFVEEGEREALLALLRKATPEEVDALARLAQATPPEARAGLRRELLAQPAAARAAWLQARLQR